uniref:E3 ubiquitin-protein ligase HERC2 n=1 Tax=Lygus hesperus TaxID=30085 RepID=A0A0A9ZD86_LYGHE
MVPKGSNEVEINVVTMLFEVLEESTPIQRSLFLQFVWGTGILPADILQKNIRMTISVVDYPDSDMRLPTSHTCFMLLELPNYSTKEILREKLTMALHCDEINF